MNSNKKGQLGVGLFLMTAVALIVGLTIFSGSIGPNIGSMTLLSVSTNQSVTASATANGTVEINGKAVSGDATITNRTSGAIIQSVSTGTPGESNFSLVSLIGTDGQKSLFLKSLDRTNGTYGGQIVNLSYTWQPDGYADDTGSRSVIALIGIFSALAILTVALVPSLRSGVADFIGG